MEMLPQRGYIDTKNTQQDTAINSKAEKADVLLPDGSQSMTDNLKWYCD